MSEAAQIPATEIKAQELQRAFDVFNQVSLELTQAYETLQARVESLTAELAVANGELRRQYQEKEALSERLSLLLKALPAGVVVLDSSAVVRVPEDFCNRVLCCSGRYRYFKCRKVAFIQDRCCRPTCCCL